MRTQCTLISVLLLCPVVYTQAAPSATAGKAKLSYSVRYSQTGESGESLGNWHTASPSASLDYSTGRGKFPFSTEYAGGYTWTLTGPSYTSGLFQRLLISQELALGKWNVALSDDVSYRPQAPTTGFSGIPGTGEPLGGVSDLPPSQGILTVNTHALENRAQGELGYLLSHQAIVNIELGHDYLHYPESDGIDSRAVTTSAGIDFRLDARNLLNTRYAFSRFSYPGYIFHIETNAATLGLTRSWTRSLRTRAAAGPEWLKGSSGVLDLTTGLTATGALDYQRRRSSIGVAFSRGFNAGSGYMIGSLSNDLSAGLSRQFSRGFVFEVNSGFRRTSELATGAWNVSGAYGGVQASWRLGRNLDAFANYTASSQNSSTKVSSNILNQTIQTFSFGIGFTKDMKAAR